MELFWWRAFKLAVHLRCLRQCCVLAWSCRSQVQPWSPSTATIRHLNICLGGTSRLERDGDVVNRAHGFGRC